jgi:phosphatidylinositol 4-kinase
MLLEMLAKGNEHLPCFGGNSSRAIDEMRRRFRPDMHDHAAVEFVHTLIDQSIDNWTTSCYDRYQRLCVGIF